MILIEFVENTKMSGQIPQQVSTDISPKTISGFAASRSFKAYAISLSFRRQILALVGLCRNGQGGKDFLAAVGVGGST